MCLSLFSPIFNNCTTASNYLPGVALFVYLTETSPFTKFFVVINLDKVDANKKLGEWGGLCKIDKEGNARKVVGCSCAVVKDWGKQGQAHDVLNEYFTKKQ